MESLSALQVQGENLRPFPLPSGLLTCHTPELENEPQVLDFSYCRRESLEGREEVVSGQIVLPGFADVPGG